MNPPQATAPPSVQRLLGDDEHALLVFRASPAMILLASWLTVAVCAAIAAAALALGAVTGQAQLAAWVAGAAAIVALVRVIWAGLVWLARRYALTDQRAVRIGGVIGRLTLEAPLDRIQQTVALQSPGERLLGLGTLGFLTAATGGVDVYWAQVARPYEKLRAARRAMREATPRTRQARRGRWPLVVGLAGGIGSGKSTVAKLLGEMGAVVSDSDAEARQALQRADVRAKLVDMWGPEILDESGAVDRAMVAGIVFSLPDAREKLEQIIHPIVHRRRLRQLVRARRDRAPALVIDAPLLFEANVDQECDLVVFVDAPLEARLERVRVGRGWDAEELRRREAAQMDLREKRRRADEVIVNDGDEQGLRQRTRALFEHWIAGEGSGRSTRGAGGKAAGSAV